MIFADPTTLVTVASWFTIGKDAVTIAGLGWGVFKLVYWVKDKLSTISNNVIALDASLSSKLDTVRHELKSQTEQLVAEQKETRNDMKTFLFPALLQQATITARAKPKPKKNLTKR
jgi:hypothetical protein